MTTIQLLEIKYYCYIAMLISNVSIVAIGAYTMWQIKQILDGVCSITVRF